MYREFGTSKISRKEVADMLVAAARVKRLGGPIDLRTAWRLDLYLMNDGSFLLTIDGVDAPDLGWVARSDVTFGPGVIVEDAVDDLLEGLQLSYQNNHENLGTDAV